uniref:Uncharacterized protein n=1 Tax=Oryza meridionalis TaxID=40149 RepID=A0A0E0D7R2_9ORYZ
MEDWVVLSGSDGGDSVELHDGSESSFAVVHENAEISDAAESNCGHVDSKIAAAKDTTFSGEEDLDDETDDIECFDEEDGICEENPDDEIFDDEEELDDDDESLDDDDIECYDRTRSARRTRMMKLDDEEEIDCEEDLDDDDDDCESLDDDDIECFDAEDIICLETRTMKSSTNIAILDDDDIECFDAEEIICEENPDDEIIGSDGGDSVELHDGSDVGGSDTESSFAVVQVRGRAADTPAIAVEAVPSQPSPSPPGFFKTVSYGQAFSGIASEHVAASSHAPVLDAAEEDIAEVSPVIVGGEHENAEISDVVESNNDHVDSNIDAATEVTTFSGEDLDDETDGDIECFDEDDGICEENPDDEIFDDEEEESDPEEEDIGSSGLETDSDEYIESTDEESDYEEEDTTDLESDSDEDTESTESSHDEDLDDDDKSLDDDGSECFDEEGIICAENPDDEIFDDESVDIESSDEEESDDEEDSYSDEEIDDEEESDCDEEIDEEEEEHGGNKYDAIDNESFGEEESCMEQSDAEEEWPEFTGVPVSYNDIDTDSDMEIDGGKYDDIDSESLYEEESVTDEQSDNEEEPEEFAGGGYDDIDYESLNGDDFEEYLQVLADGGIDNESFGEEESVLDDEALDFFHGLNDEFLDVFYGDTLYDYETESSCAEECEHVCVCGRCMELIDGEDFYQLTGDEFDATQHGEEIGGDASGADEEEPSDAGESDHDTAPDAGDGEAHGDSADMAGGNSAAAAAEPASTPSQFQQAMQQAAARDQAAAAMVRAADAIDSYMRAAAGGLAAQDVEALSQGATGLRAMAAAPSFAVGVGASNAAVAAAAAFLPDPLARQDGVVSLAVFYLLFGVDWVVLSGSDGGDSVELHDGSESSFAVVHENAEISDAAESNYDHSLDDDDIESYDVEDEICEENPDDEIFDDEEEIDCEEDRDDDDDDDESLDDDDVECFDAEDIICKENPDDEIMSHLLLT